MNSENKEIDQLAKNASDSPSGKKTAGGEDPLIPQPRSRRSASGGLALLLSTLALAGTAWMWWQADQQAGTESQRAFAELARLEEQNSATGASLAELRDEVRQLPSGDDSQELEQLEQRIASDRRRVQQLESSIEDQLALSRSLQAAAEAMQGRLLAAEASLSGMSSRELDAGGELDLAEVDYLLRLANERLKLFADPVAADQALEVADQHLAAMNNPMYLGVRREISSARNQLANLELPDFLALSSSLDELQGRIADLAFIDETVTVTPEVQEATGQGWWDKIKGAFSGLVTVRRSTEQENQRISLQDKDFIRQRLWLQLEIAHLALMRRDEQAWQHALARVEESLGHGFDPDTAELESWQKDLAELRSMPVSADVPDITAPWSTLRMIRAGQARPAVQPAAPVEQTEAELNGDQSEESPVMDDENSGSETG